MDASDQPPVVRLRERSAGGSSDGAPGHVPGHGTTVSIKHVVFLLIVVVCIVPATLAIDPVAGLNRRAWPYPLVYVAYFTTHFGKAQWALVPTGLVVLAYWCVRWSGKAWRDWPPPRFVAAAAFLFTSVGVASLLGGMLKWVFGRVRPELFESAGAFGIHPLAMDAAYLSFPSGHATTVGAFFMGIALLWPRLLWPAILVGAWLALTRVFVGAHYPSDVVVGALLGAYTTLLFSYVFARYLTFAHLREAPPGAAAAATAPGERGTQP